MLPTTGKVKPKASRPRVKTGCATCRKRRIKCDEARPACGGCVRSGWKCDGYATASPSRAKSPTQQQLLNITSYSIPFRIPGSQKDRQMLHYFCSQGASDMSGFLSSNFWSETILRQSHQEPAIRQLLLALSSLHLDYITSDSKAAKLATEGTLQQYGKGLRMLRKRLESPSPEGTRIALISSIVFYCFESALGNSEAAIQHLDKGLMMLGATKDLGDHDDAEAIVELFIRLDIQATLFNDMRMPILDLTSADEKQYGFIESPELPFRSLQEAQRKLSQLQNWFFRFLIQNVPTKECPIEDIPPSLIAEKKQLAWQFSLWGQKSQQPITTTPTKPGDEQEAECGMNILQTQYIAIQMLLQANCPHNPLVFESSPNPAAEEMLHRAELIVRHAQNANANASTARNPRRSFSSETGIVASLALLIIKCTDPSIIEKATRLLSQAQRQEGLYDAAAMVAIVQHLEGIKQVRAQSEEGSEPKSLEYWTWDLMNGAPAGMKKDGTMVPLSVLPVAYDGSNMLEQQNN